MLENFLNMSRGIPSDPVAFYGFTLRRKAATSKQVTSANARKPPAMQDPSGVNKQLYDMFGWFNIPACNIDGPVHLNIKVYLSDSISMRQRLNDLAITLIRNMFSLRCNVTHTFRVTRCFNFFLLLENTMLNPYCMKEETDMTDYSYELRPLYRLWLCRRGIHDSADRRPRHQHQAHASSDIGETGQRTTR